MGKKKLTTYENGPHRVMLGDCRKVMADVKDKSVNLLIVDPPYNIGYEYEEYDDSPDDEAFLALMQETMAHTHRVLTDDGAFWLIIGDKMAAQLKMMATQNKILAQWYRGIFKPFYLRDWVIWYYTFGTACTKSFSKSHTHIFHFTKQKGRFIFNADDKQLRVPSARQLVYNDKRANSAGKLPDNTWILSPLDLSKTFTPDEDTWLFSRVAGTFKERKDRGQYGERRGTPQLPAKLLERIVVATSNPGDVVMDPMCGTGSTLSAAIRLGRQAIGIDQSEACFKMSQDQIKEAVAQCPRPESKKPVPKRRSRAK